MLPSRHCENNERFRYKSGLSNWSEGVYAGFQSRFQKGVLDNSEQSKEVHLNWKVLAAKSSEKASDRF